MYIYAIIYYLFELIFNTLILRFSISSLRISKYSLFKSPLNTAPTPPSRPAVSIKYQYPSSIPKSGLWSYAFGSVSKYNH